MIEESKRVPLGVKIISGFYFFEALIALIIGIFIILDIVLYSGNILALLIFSLLGLGTALFLFVLGIMLWKGKSWARIIIIILSILSMGSIIRNNLTMNSTIFLVLVISLVLHAIIVGYLLFSKKVKVAFSKN